MSAATVQTQWFGFRQNNSGGSFRAPAILVCIEAVNGPHAVGIAEGLGLYFNGEGDCPCCGDRWSDYDAKEGHPVPSQYGEPIATATSERWTCWGNAELPDVLLVPLTGEQSRLWWRENKKRPEGGGIANSDAPVSAEASS